MRSYYLPREYKGEGRILYIFSTKSLIGTGIGAAIGYFLNLLLAMFGINNAMVVLLIVFGLIGYGLTTIKMPESNSFQITKKTGGERLDEIIKRWILFKLKHGKIYIYEEKINNKTNEGEEKNEQ